MHNELFSARLCNICLLLNSKIKYKNIFICNGCHLVHYCSGNHQKIDWPLHKEFCQAIQKIVKFYQIKHPYQINGIPSSPLEMENTIIKVKSIITAVLMRPLHSHEEELTSFPSYCAVCYKFNKVYPCSRCQAISYCSKHHESVVFNKHKKVCDILKLYYCNFKVHKFEIYNIKALYMRIPDLHKSNLKDSFERISSIKLPEEPSSSLQSYQLFSTAADFSCIATICYSLEFEKLQTYRNSNFSIFIVGASVERKLWFREIHLRFFFLQFAQIEKLSLYFIGPEVMDDPNHKMQFKCQGIDRCVEFKTYRGLFQDFSRHYKRKPSLIISFNCGFSEFVDLYNNENNSDNILIQSKNTWPEGIMNIVQIYNIPIVFTSFTKEEAHLDYSVLECLIKNSNLPIKINKICSIRQNPYKDLRPLRNWQLTNDNEIYYRNGYIQAISSNHNTS